MHDRPMSWAREYTKNGYKYETFCKPFGNSDGDNNVAFGTNKDWYNRS